MPRGNVVSIVLLILAAVAFFLAVVIPVRNPPHPAALYRVQIVAAGLCLWAVEVLLYAAKVT